MENNVLNLNSKAKKICQDIIQKYQNNIIKTKTELFYEIKNSLNDFYSSVGNPTFKPYYAKGVPKLEDYNCMIKTFINDIDASISECDLINQTIGVSFEDIDIDKKILVSSTKAANKSLVNLKDSVHSFANNRCINFTNSFEKSNPGFSPSMLTLPTKMVLDNTENSKIEVVESNGFPGNSHIIEHTEIGLVFTGQGNLRNDATAIKNKDEDSWLEYELFNISDDTYDKCNGMGFHYKEDISWVTEEKELKLVLRLTPSNISSECNWLSISPFFPASKSYKPAILEKIILANEKTNIKYIPVEKAFDDEIVIFFENQKIEFVEIYFSQQNAYPEEIGHIYSTKLSKDVIVYDETTNSSYSRVDLFEPSVNCLGVSYDPKEKKVIHRKSEEDYKYDPSELFLLPSTSGNYKHGIEVLQADRYMIGIKNISLCMYQFEEEGVFVSENYIVKEEISEITLNSKEKLQSSCVDGEEVSIKYSLTFDDGNSWHEIYPKEKAYLGPCTIRINSEEAPFEREKSTKIKYIDRLLETKSFKLKIELKKSKKILYGTPIIYNYRLDVKTGDDKIDY